MEWWACEWWLVWWAHRYHPNCSFMYLLGFKRRTLRLLGKQSVTWATPVALFGFPCYFLERVLCFCQWIACTMSFLPTDFRVAGITDRPQVSYLLRANFLLRLALNHDLPSEQLRLHARDAAPGPSLMTLLSIRFQLNFLVAQCFRILQSAVIFRNAHVAIWQKELYIWNLSVVSYFFLYRLFFKRSFRFTAKLKIQRFLMFPRSPYMHTTSTFLDIKRLKSLLWCL
jgi:hypothetical protein